MDEKTNAGEQPMNPNPEEVVSTPDSYSSNQNTLQPPKEESALKASWKDIVKSEGWFGKVFQLMIMGLIPFVGFFVNGYILDWSQTLIKGVREALPKRAFNSKAFTTGFFYWVITVICWWASLILVVFMPIPVLGAIIIFVLNVFVTAYAMIAGIRMALYGRFSAAFDLSDIWSVMKKDLGSLFVAVFVPALIVFAIAFALGAILVLCVAGSYAASASAARTLSSLSGSSSMLGYGLTTSPYAYSALNDPLAMVAQIAAVALPLLILFVIIIAMLAVFMNIWQMRAVAHWAKKNASEWAKN